MATISQIQANRLNAQKPTGPRSAEGKASSSFNAFKHGARARIIPERTRATCWISLANTTKNSAPRASSKPNSWNPSRKIPSTRSAPPSSPTPSAPTSSTSSSAAARRPTAIGSAPKPRSAARPSASHAPRIPRPPPKPAPAPQPAPALPPASTPEAPTTRPSSSAPPATRWAESTIAAISNRTTQLTSLKIGFVPPGITEPRASAIGVAICRVNFLKQQTRCTRI